MSNERNYTITYKGAPITLFSDDQNDFVNLTELAKAYKTTRAIAAWLKSKQTIQFMGVWEQKYNPKFSIHGFEYFLSEVKQKNFSLSVNLWVEKTNAIGIYSRVGQFAGTYAHRDIAFKFAYYLNPALELHLIEEIKRLRKIEEQKNSLELLSHEQILNLVRLKEVFKYVAHQQAIEDANKDVFASKSNSKNPFAEFHKFRNDILGISPSVIDERIKEYCKARNIALTTSILSKPKREKILLLDSYELVRNAVWDFLYIKGEINALTLAKLAENMIRIERGEVLRENKDDLFHNKQDLGAFSNFLEDVHKMKEVKTAREVLALREEQKKKTEPTEFDTQLKGLLSVPKPPKRK